MNYLLFIVGAYLVINGLVIGSQAPTALQQIGAICWLWSAGDRARGSDRYRQDRPCAPRKAVVVCAKGARPV
jgi:hypothetical protein